MDFYIELCGPAKFTYLCQFKCGYFGFSTYKIMPFANSDSFINLFLNFILFLPCLPLDKFIFYH